MRYQVHTDALRDDSTGIAVSTGGLATTPTDLARALRAIGAASGSSQISAVAEVVARAWSGTAHGMAQRATGLSRGLGAAGTTYDAAELSLGRPGGDYAPSGEYAAGSDDPPGGTHD